MVMLRYVIPICISTVSRRCYLAVVFIELAVTSSLLITPYLCQIRRRNEGSPRYGSSGPDSSVSD